MQKSNHFLSFTTFGISLALVSFLTPNNILAAENATSSTEITIEKKAKTGDINAESATQILQNLERLAKDPNQSEQIKDKYEGVTNKTRGFIAQITSLKDDSFKIITPNNEEFFITPDKSTTIVKKGKSTTGENYTPSEWFAIDDWLVLIGVQNGETFQPRRVLVSSESLAPEQTFVLRASIKTVQKDKFDAVIIGTDNTVETFKIEKTANLVNQSNETITYKDLAPDVSVILIGVESEGKKTLQTLRLL